MKIKEKYETFVVSAILRVKLFHCFRQLSNLVTELWAKKTETTSKQTFYSAKELFLGPVHITPEEFENAAIFLRLGLPSTLIRRNCPLWKERNLKTELCVLVWTENILKTALFEKALENGALRFSVDGKHFENGAFWKRWRHDNHVTCLPESSSNTNPKWRPKWFKKWREQQSG